MLDRSAFLYMEGKDSKFAQCGACLFWLSGRERCELHSDKDVIPGTASCGLYVHGQPGANGRCLGKVTPKESGLVDRKVRCENCRHFSYDRCRLFGSMNARLTGIFKLDTKVSRYGCCNAQEAK